MKAKQSNLSLVEQETSILYNRASDKAEIYTADPFLIADIRKKAKANSKEWIITKDYSDSIFAECPKSLIRMYSKTANQNLTEQEKKEISNRLSKAREQSKNRV